MESPEYYHQTSFASGEVESKPGGEHFLVEDLLDLSNDENGGVTANDVVMEDNNDQDSSTVTTAVDSCNSSGNASAFSSLDDSNFCTDLSVPEYDDLAELEWLSNFVEESFSSEEEIQKLQLISGHVKKPPDGSSSDISTRTDLDRNSAAVHNMNNPNHIFHPETMSVPAKARSKRSRTAPMNWTSRLLVLSKPAPVRKQRLAPEGEERKCMHCATDKTPQWRTGPMGPKTLCNACGVRYKSGRLVPEYRPAASPTFVLTKHSNSHRKVMELRRQKEFFRAHYHHAGGGGMFCDMGSSNGDDFLIHKNVGSDFRQLI